MRKLLNTIYITSEGSYLALDGETIVIKREDQKDVRVPMHNIESVIVFTYTGASPALMGSLASRNISLTFLTPQGRFLSRIIGRSNGNVLLRKKQYRVSDSEELSLEIAKNIISAKLHNSRFVIERTTRDHPLRVDVDLLKNVSASLKNSIKNLQSSESLDELRGFEGEAASRYFSVFNQLILQENKEFYFYGRTKRPPTDRVNAMLSFVYTILANDVASALESVGLDSYVGFLHRDRPGRASLALDLMEELRSVMADRFVLSLINKKVITKSDFITEESGGVLMKDKGRNTLLTSWQSKKSQSITHPFLDEKISWGLVPYAQALLLSRFLRGDLDGYPSFLWK